MNAIQQAMKEAGVTLPPANKQLWLWLKDHPRKTYKEISAALGWTTGVTSSILTNLFQRGMLTKVEDIAHAVRDRRKVIARYSCRYQEWELLPKPLLSRTVPAKKAETPKASANDAMCKVVGAATPAEYGSKSAAAAPKANNMGRPKKNETAVNPQHVVLTASAVELLRQAQDRFEADTLVRPTQSQIITMQLTRYVK